MDFNVTSASDLFSAISDSGAQRQSLSYSAVNRGAARLQEKNYEAAAREFRRATAYDPSSIQAYRLLGRAYELQGKTEDAIATYKRALVVDTSSDIVRNDLATIYMKNQRYAEAEQEFLRIARTNPASAGTAAALGHIYLATGRNADAETQFQKAARLAPQDPAAHYSLGLMYNKQERYSEAVPEFKRAIELRRDYAMAHADLAYSYLGLGQDDAAQNEVNELITINTDESNSLAYEVELTMLKPGIQFENLVDGTFNTRLGPGTTLDQLDPSLATPGASKSFSMVFQFNQSMDIASVQDVFNWTITKASGGKGGVYNNGVNLHPEKEVSILPHPTAARWDPLSNCATIYFNVTQNAAGDGVMDPSHWVFGFNGTDAGGNPMDTDADQYDWSGGAF
jgi:tetratricopeptide (TPR) repeat protein